jgi:hypothetical protein
MRHTPTLPSSVSQRSLQSCSPPHSQLRILGYTLTLQPVHETLTPSPDTEHSVFSSCLKTVASMPWIPTGYALIGEFLIEPEWKLRVATPPIVNKQRIASFPVSISSSAFKPRGKLTRPRTCVTLLLSLGKAMPMEPCVSNHGSISSTGRLMQPWRELRICLSIILSFRT